MVVSWRDCEWGSIWKAVEEHLEVWERLQEVVLLNFVDCELLRDVEDLLDPLVRMWCPDDHAFDVWGVLFPLQLHDIYFLMGLPIRGE